MNDVGHLLSFMHHKLHGINGIMRVLHDLCHLPCSDIQSGHTWTLREFNMSYFVHSVKK